MLDEDLIMCSILIGEDQNKMDFEAPINKRQLDTSDHLDISKKTKSHE